MRGQELIVSAMGEAALLCETERPLNDADQRRYWAMARAAEAWPGVLEAIPGVNNLLVVYDPAAASAAAVERALREAWTDAVYQASESRLIEVPVIYGGELGMDLHGLAAHAGLSPEEVVRIHSEAEYTVYAVGAVPGFPYMAGLDPRLAWARRDVPRLRLEAGSIIIGGVQAGIMPVTTPSGWHSLGWTPMPFFDAAASPPALLVPGDRVRFTVEELRL
ncbi:5-oxoprolinase subunit PxpB [Teichococcus oryzae]|uniref:5-oxoprolinase subunit PxpB n=1 Tax=Teichococcus oryzae TaxID=1608942 RepID=A0A5B2TG58_9PROT|nr:5-oxoprolinase subunit PxpB [Pseudoroseomonas oryzae]KAA2212975.1 5-oxoprolinase subunit PxpB [Pseudoroseomonas oryzae]